ncbi:head GIN domain-containing protein [Algoriphagus sediminis]|uniref:Head GIN domain-containing protein n=1 Tax=Algoriphagus sediminis TaxID=3057113 RepID=A0ABT7Y9Y4_9BACT|nr:head GIN domain-containing protein [Algoriphagus sediminis]MDN3203318.1 head GIN domain-containing protein [Algoriphagus sediminis]
MKTKLSTAFIILLFLLGVTAQAQNSETRTPGSFTKIESGGNWDVYVTIGNKDEVRLESRGFDLDKVITEVNGDKLKIKLENGRHRNVNITAYVTVRELEAIGGSGSGSIFVESDVQSRSFSIGQSGSGSIELQNLETDKLNVGISGSGLVSIEGGRAGNVDIGQSGSADFKAIDLIAESVKVGKSGSGDVHIGVENDLIVASSGSGDIYVNGNPKNQKISSSGSSQIIIKN